MERPIALLKNLATPTYTWILDNSDDNFQTAMPKIVVFFGFR